jgi:formylglycine-generating enzyme
MKYYLRHAAYGGYPVVGVSWQQATDYCAWRTKRVKEYLEANGKLEKAPKIFTYRLPMFEEWKMMYAEVERLPFLIGDEGRRSYKGMARFNMKREAGDMATQAGQLNDNADVTAPAKSYWPNQYGVYNIKGNVSEWLLEKDTHIGGAWNVKTDADVSVKQALQTSSATVGFRCVCEVVDDAA